MLPGMAAGWIFEKIKEMGMMGFSGDNPFEMYFWFVMLCCVITFVACRLVWPSLSELKIKN